MLTAKQFEEFRRETEIALEKIANKYNVNVHAGKIKYTADKFDLVIEVTKKEVNGKTFEQSEFEKHCVWYDLKPEDYNKEFTFNGEKYNLTGFATRSTKMPVLAKCSNGKTFKFGTDTIKRLIKS